MIITPAKATIDRVTSLQISIVRVVCILFMMTVHVNPAVDWSARQGFDMVMGVIVTDVLGRASVAALSFVSGWLLYETLRNLPATTIAMKRLSAVYVPMVTWNTVHLALMMAAFFWLGVQTDSFDGSGSTNALNLIATKILFLFGEPANESLGFLRDLFASALVVLALHRIFGQRLALTLPIVFVLSVYHAMEPIVFRPNITLFMLAGFVLRQHGGGLQWVSGLRVVSLPLFGFVIVETLWPMTGLLGTEVGNIFRRAVLTVVALDVALLLARTSMGVFVGRFDRHTFLAYLCHGTVISILWVLWKQSVGNETDPSYLVFFVSAPFVAFVCAILAAPIISFLPTPVQIMIRGKAKSRPALHPAPAPL